MVPVGECFGGFARLVRDMGKRAGKEVEFLLEGEETSVDRRLAQILVEPLTHLIRNSIDHGIETKTERGGFGKRICRAYRVKSGTQG